MNLHSVAQHHSHIPGQTDSCLNKIPVSLFSHENGATSLTIWTTVESKTWKGNPNELRVPWWTRVKVIHKCELGFSCLKTEIEWVKSIYSAYSLVRSSAKELHNRLSRTSLSDHGRQKSWVYGIHACVLKSVVKWRINQYNPKRDGNRLDSHAYTVRE